MDAPSSSDPDLKKDKRRGWAAAKSFMKNQTLGQPPPSSNDPFSSLAVPSSSTHPTSSSSDRSSLNTSTNSRASEDSSATAGEDSVRLVRRSAVNKRQASGTSIISNRRASRAAGAGGGHAPRSATEELARQLDGEFGSSSLDSHEHEHEEPELPKVEEAEETSTSNPIIVTSSHDPEPPQVFPPSSSTLPPHQIFDSPTSDTLSPPTSPRSAFPFPHSTTPPLLSPSLVVKSPPLQPSKPRLTLPPLNTNTVYLPPPSRISPQLPSPSQAHWKSVRDIVVGPSTTSSASNTPSPSPGVTFEEKRRQKEESYPPERDRGGSQHHGGGDERDHAAGGGFFRSKFGGGFRGVADQAMQSLAAGKHERERGKTTTTTGSLSGAAACEGGDVKDASAFEDGKTSRSSSVKTTKIPPHPQYLRFEHEMSNALKQERRNRLLSTLANPSLASQLGVPSNSTPSSATNPTSAHSSTYHNTSRSNTSNPVSYPTQSSRSGSVSATNATTPHSTTSSRASTLFLPSPSLVPPPLSALLKVLHVYVPYASQPWAQPLPCAAEVLVELGRAFASGGGEGCGDGGKGMSLEVFTLVVKYWRSGTKEEEGERWRWCLNVLEGGDDALRSRTFPLLISLLSPTSPTSPIPTHPLSVPPTSPLALQSLLLALLRLTRTIASSPTSTPGINTPQRSNTGGGARAFANQNQAPNQVGEKEMLARLVGRVRRGEVVKLEREEVWEGYGGDGTEGGAWDGRRVSEAVAWEGVVMALGVGNESERRSVLRGEVETFWPELFPSDLGTLTTLIHQHALLLFLQTTHTYFLQSSSSTSDSKNELERDRLLVLDLVRNRVLPQVDLLASSSSSDGGDETLAVKTMGFLVALSLGGKVGGGGGRDLDEEVAGDGAWALVEDLWADGDRWKAALSVALKEMVASESLPLIDSVLRLVVNRDDISKASVKEIVPALFERLVREPTASRSLLLPLLLELQDNRPQTFYRPLFGCASSDKSDIVLHNHEIIAMLFETLGVAKFWLSDAEMVAMAVAGGKAGGGETLTWGKMKLGQMVVLVDLTNAVRRLGEDEEGLEENEAVARSRFFESLEARLAVLIESRERTSLLPFSHRSLLATLLFEIRSSTQSLRRAPWIARVVAWGLEAHVGSIARPAPLPFSPSANNNPFLEPAPPVSTEFLEVDEMAFGELAVSLHRVRSVFEPKLAGVSAQAKSAKRETSTLLDLVSPSSARPTSARPQPKRSATSSSIVLEPTAREEVSQPVMLLLVAVNSLLSMQDLSSLGPVIYQHHLGGDWSSLGPAVFLLSLAAEKTPSSLLAVIASETESLNSNDKLAMLSRLSTIFSWRSRVLSQPFIQDRQRRRPFKSTKDVIAFIPTDVGLAKYLPVAAQDATYLRFGGSLPFSVRSRLMTLGWDTDQKEESSRSDWERTPVSLLSSDFLETSSDAAPPSPAKSVLPDRPKSSLARRRSATQDASGQPPVFSSLFITALGRQLSSLIHDPDGSLAAAGRETLLTIGREDASLIARPLLGRLGVEGVNVPQILSSLRNLLSAQHDLPPAFSHFVFNHLAGLLKSLAKVGDAKSLETYSLVLPLMADLSPQVTELSIRELRRNKADLLCLPTGAFWFDETAPRLPMFPRQLAPIDEHGSSTGLHEMVAIRTSQNMLLLSILRRDRKEAYTIKKVISSFLLPRVLRGNSRSSRTYIPEKQASSDGEKSWISQTTTSNSAARDLRAASRLLSRSWLLVVHQVFLSLNRNYGDRVELAHSLEGVNEILSAHWDDPVIVGHALQIYMTASTRFRRLFNSASAFALILPPIFLAYSQAESIPAIREAIEYAFRRLFNVHVESMVFQSIASISAVLLHNEVTEDSHRRWISRNVFELLSSLSQDEPETAGRSVGIRGLNHDNEREALISLVNDAPEIILSDLRNGSRTEEEIKEVVSNKWEEKTFPLGDVVKLFLTVIAHDPSSSRAESFLRVLRNLAVDFVGAGGSAGDILREGVEALGQVFVKNAAKAPDGASSKAAVVSWNELDYSLLPGQLREVDWLSMRRDYLLLVQSFAAGGGRLSGAGLRRTLEMVPGLLRESGSAAAEPAAAFLREFTRTTLLDGDAPSLKEAMAYLRDLAPLVRGYADLVDFSGVLDAIGALLLHPHLRSEPSFAKMVVDDFILPSLQTCSMASAEGSIFSLPIRTATVNLLARSVFLSSSDVLSNLARQSPTPAFLAGIVLPLALALKTTAEIDGEHPRARQEIQGSHSRAYLQLLDFALRSCTSSSLSGSKERTRHRGRSPSPTPSPARNVLSKPSSSPEPRGRHRSDESSVGGSSVASDQRSAAAVVVLALEIVKVIIVKASDDLSRHIGIWNTLADFLKTLLDSGDGRFLLGGGLRRRSSFEHDTSPTSSRGGSPTPQARFRDRPISGFSDTSYSFAGSSTPRASFQASTLTSRTSPSILDASMWSLLQLLVSFSTPLFLVLRPWIRTKMVQQLESVVAGGGHEGASRSLSSSTATRTSMGGGRRLSSNFARDTKHESLLFVNRDPGGTPRRRGSAEEEHGGGRGRDVSSSSRASWTIKLDELSSRHSVSRLSLDGRFDQSSFIDQHPQIRHLPLPSNQPTPSTIPSCSTPSAILLSHASAAKGLIVSSPILVDITIRAIRAVEEAFGIATGEDEEENDDDAEERRREVSQVDALARIVEESKAWIFGGEFSEVFEGGGDGSGGW